MTTTINTDDEMTGLELNKRIQELQEQDEKIQQLMKAFGTQPRNATLRLNSGEEFCFKKGCLHRIWYPQG